RNIGRLPRSFHRGIPKISPLRPRPISGEGEEGPQARAGASGIGTAPPGGGAVHASDRSEADYRTVISTTRLRGSRTPSGVGTGGCVSPTPRAVIRSRATPARASASLTALARRSESRWL